MTVLVTDPFLEERLKKDREASGADRYDEVWEGVYMMTPRPNDEHQQIVSRLVSILEEVVGWPGLAEVRPGVNLSDCGENWKQDYRVPDVAVFLREGKAENCDTHWRGPADFLVEIISPGDRTREKIPFYQRLGVVELLLIDRNPWRLELYGSHQGQLRKIGQSELDRSDVLQSTVVPLSFQLLGADPRPRMEVTRTDSDRSWSV